MHTVSGISVSGGIAAGPLRVWKRTETRLSRVSRLAPGQERARFEAACKTAGSQLDGLYRQVLAEAGKDSAAIFEIHRMMLEDEDYLEAVMSVLETQGATAEYAAQEAGRQLSAAFSAMNSEYMQARAADVTDISRRVIRILTGQGGAAALGDRPVILAAGELTPSELVRLDRSRLLGFLTRCGSAASHTAILARTMNIPALTGVDFDEDWDGRTAVLDGCGGRLYLDPDRGLLAAMEEKRQGLLRDRALLQGLRDLPSVTLDGREIQICANIGGPADAALALENGAQGVGLFRSEFLYLNAEKCPGEEEQLAAYRQAVRAMAGRRVVIRTLDAGADKRADCLCLEREENPALGLRAIRLCLERKELFRTQLRAILRAAAFGPVSILFPMIASLWEVREARALLEDCRSELQAEGAAPGGVRLGVMIETPAAVMIAGELAKEVDFFSIGTNDLTQYTLAADRQDPRLERFRDPRHPAVLRMIGYAVEAGHRHGCRVAICGGLAADRSLTETFLRMGVDELSVPPSDILPLRRLVRGLDLRGEQTPGECPVRSLNGADFQGIF